MTSKTIQHWLVFNWKTGKSRTRQSEPGELGTHELATRLNLEVEIPEVEVPELAAKIDVPQPVVQTAVIESLDGESLPDHADEAAELVDRHRDRLYDGGLSPEERSNLYDELTGKLMIEYDGYVDPEDARETIKRLIGDQI